MENIYHIFIISTFSLISTHNAYFSTLCRSTLWSTETFDKNKCLQFWDQFFYLISVTIVYRRWWQQCVPWCPEGKAAPARPWTRRSWQPSVGCSRVRQRASWSSFLNIFALTTCCSDHHLPVAQRKVWEQPLSLARSSHLLTTSEPRPRTPWVLAEHTVTPCHTNTSVDGIIFSC